MDVNLFNKLRLGGEAFNAVSFSILTVVSLVVLLLRIKQDIILGNKLYHVWISLFLCFLVGIDRAISQSILIVIDIMAVIECCSDVIPYVEQLALGIDMFGYPIGAIMFGIIIIIWIYVLLSILIMEGKEYQRKIFTYFIIPYIYITSIFITLACIPATISYLSMQGLVVPSLIEGTLYYTAIPIYVYTLVVFSIIMGMVGLYVLSSTVRIQLKSKPRERQVIAKIIFVLFVFILASIGRAISTVIYMFQIEYWSYLQSILFLTGFPDMLIIINVNICFFQFTCSKG